jgi:REP element-mobilizing transposase RayT
MSRTWLLTSTFYGNWLPGDPRGSVTRVRDLRPDDEDCVVRLEHDRPGTPYDDDLPGLWKAALRQMRGPRIRIEQSQAEALSAQFQETATYRGWTLQAFAIMFNHVHWVVTVSGDPSPSDLLRDFKSYGSRVLNRKWGKRPNDTWWTESGSKRKLKDESAVQTAVRYVRRQPIPLVIWTADPSPRNVQEPHSGG